MGGNASRKVCEERESEILHRYSNGSNFSGIVQGKACRIKDGLNSDGVYLTLNKSADQEVPKKFRCIVCSDCMVNPVQITHCGHRMCGACVPGNDGRCPGCAGSDVTVPLDYVTDVALQKDLAAAMNQQNMRRGVVIDSTGSTADKTKVANPDEFDLNVHSDQASTIMGAISDMWQQYKKTERHSAPGGIGSWVIWAIASLTIPLHQTKRGGKGKGGDEVPPWYGFTGISRGNKEAEATDGGEDRGELQWMEAMMAHLAEKRSEQEREILLERETAAILRKQIAQLEREVSTSGLEPAG